MNTRERIRLLHRAWRYRLRAERREIALVRALVCAGDVVLDIGAHKAAFTYWMANRIGPGGRVLAFEPNPSLAEYLTEVSKLFPSACVQVVETALSNRQGRAKLHFPGGHLGSASLELTDDVLRMPIEVPTISLDGYLASIGWQRSISFIKCDVEYHELAVLEGAADVLRRDKPVLLVESGDFVRERYRLTPVQEYLAELGFKGFFFHKSKLVPIAEFDPHLHPPVDDDHQNYVFVHPVSSGSRHATLLKLCGDRAWEQSVA